MIQPTFLKFTAATLIAFSLTACGGGAEPNSESEGGNFDAAAIDTSELPSSFPALADQIIEDSGEVATLLSGVSDAETAEAIKPRLAEMAQNYRAMLTKFDEMGEPGFSDMAALAGRLPKIATSQSALFEEVERIYQNHPESYDVLAESLEGLTRTTP